MLPANELKTIDITPKNYFLWGENMSGKTYLSVQFPNPILLNTDGNAKKVSCPSVEVKDFDTFNQILDELLEGGHTYESIIVDIVDDVKNMISEMICQKHKVQSPADVPYGRATGEIRDIWHNTMIKLTQSKYNIIFVSHMVDFNDIEKPSLGQKELNVCMGRCDVSIRCRKVGEKYLSICDRKRHNYTPNDIADTRLIDLFKIIKNLMIEGK